MLIKIADPAAIFAISAGSGGSAGPLFEGNIKYTKLIADPPGLIVISAGSGGSGRPLFKKNIDIALNVLRV